MAYSAAFLEKLAQKPDWLTPSQKARTFATMRGWEYRSPQHENERYSNMETELILAIPGLSEILDVNTAGTVTPVKFYLQRSSLGFTRRSRRRYSINVSFPEVLYFDQGTGLTDVSFRISYTWVHKTDTQGNPLTKTDSTALPTDISVSIAHSPTEVTKVGQVTFDLPTFNADPGEVAVQITNFSIQGSSSTFTPSTVKDDRGRSYQTTALTFLAGDLTTMDSTRFPAGHTESIIGATIEMVKPDTPDPR